MRRECIEYRGVKYYRYPDSKHRTPRIYFRSGNRHLHREMYKDHFGPIPPGFHVHHKDEDSSHNFPENLEVKSRSDHFRDHWLTRRGSFGERPCAECNKVFAASFPRAQWCSPACLAKKRRRLGLDDIKKLCSGCGKYFMSNRYKGSPSCSRKCGGIVRKKK